MTSRRVATLPDQAVLLALLRYDEETGDLFWLPRSRDWFTCDKAWRLWNAKYAGQPALTSLIKGHKAGKLFDKTALAHRVICKMKTGCEPVEVDHENGVRGDNRWSNLRAVDHATNNKNKAKYCSSIDLGIRSSGSSWVARINIAGKQVHLGSFPTKEAAVSARKAAELEHGYHANHGRAA